MIRFTYASQVYSMLTIEGPMCLFLTVKTNKVPVIPAGPGPDEIVAGSIHLPFPHMKLILLPTLLPWILSQENHIRPIRSSQTFIVSDEDLGCFVVEVAKRQLFARGKGVDPSPALVPLTSLAFNSDFHGLQRWLAELHSLPQSADPW